MTTVTIDGRDYDVPPEVHTALRMMLQENIRLTARVRDLEAGVPDVGVPVLEQAARLPHADPHRREHCVRCAARATLKWADSFPVDAPPLVVEP